MPQPATPLTIEHVAPSALKPDPQNPRAHKPAQVGETALMAFTDPPYNVAVHGHVSGLGKLRHREFAMGSGEMDQDAFTRFLSNAFERMVMHTVAGSLHCVCILRTSRSVTRIFCPITLQCAWKKVYNDRGLSRR